MHQYLTAIGFDKVNSRKKMNELIHEIEQNFTHHELIAAEENLDFCEFQKEFGAGIGISVFGNMDFDENFEKQYYFPYFEGTGITTYADVAVDRRMDKDSYIGVCEDVKIDITIFFHIQNTIEYLRESQVFNSSAKHISVTLSALCNEGMILLPVMKDKIQEKKQQQEVHNRMLLKSAARTGDQVAIESLTLDDLDTYSRITKRLVTEDIFSIVDTYIMPNGLECDCYSILGTILNLETIENEYTSEKLYIMRLEVNGLKFDLCVPVEKVVGEPEIGRRFKGNIWLQGRINF